MATPTKRPPVCKPPKPSVLATLKSAAQRLTKSAVKNISQAVKKGVQKAKPAVSTVVCPIKAALEKAQKSKALKAIVGVYQSPKGQLVKNLVQKGIEYGGAKIGTTKYGTFTLTGAKTLLGKANSFGGQFGAGKLTKQLATKGLGKALVGLDVVMDIGKEALQQYRAKKLDVGRLTAAAGVGAGKAVLGHLAFAAGVGLVTAGGIAGAAPIVAGIALSVLVSYLLDKADEKRDLTGKVVGLFKKKS